MRAIGLDVRLEFCEVAIAEGGGVRSAGRIETKPERLELFAQSLGADDRVALEATANAWEIRRIIEPQVAELIVVSPTDTGIRGARAKTDRLDARPLARLCAAGELEAVWVPDRQTRVMRRRLGRRGQLVWARSRAKNQIHATPMRCLIGRPPFHLFGKQGRRWLAELELPTEERESVDSALRQVEFLDAEIEAVERPIANHALGSADIKRLMTVPGVNVICAATFMAAIGDIRRSASVTRIAGAVSSAPVRGARRVRSDRASTSAMLFARLVSRSLTASLMRNARASIPLWRPATVGTPSRGERAGQARRAPLALVLTRTASFTSLAGPPRDRPRSAAARRSFAPGVGAESLASERPTG